MPERFENEGDKKAPAAAAGGVDRIGTLPDALLQHVLSFLRADKAVRTSVLSRRWRNLWKSTPSLRVTNARRFRSAEDFDKFVNHLLLLRGNSPLDKCEIDLDPYRYASCRMGDNWNVPFPYVNLWIRYALMCQVRVLQAIVDDSENKRLLINVPLISRHLTTLELQYVELDDRSMDFSGCPALENLKMSCCTISADRMSSHSLKRLCIAHCYFPAMVRTRISVPSLVSLLLDDSYGRTPLLESMPSLVTAFLRPDMDCEDLCFNDDSGDCGDESCEGCYDLVGSYQCVLLRGLSDATNLELIAAPGMYIYGRDLTWCPTFSKLKTLVLNEWCVAVDLRALVCILQHSPILEKLTLQLCKRRLRAVGMEGSHDAIQQSCACEHLKVVNIECEEDPVVNEKVHKILKILSSAALVQISIKKTIWSDRFSFQKRL